LKQKTTPIGDVNQKKAPTFELAFRACCKNIGAFFWFTSPIGVSFLLQGAIYNSFLFISSVRDALSVHIIIINRFNGQINLDGVASLHGLKNKLVRASI
jgi:hypothetical protein